MTRVDAVSPALAQAVFARDTAYVINALQDMGWAFKWKHDRLVVIPVTNSEFTVCPAALIDVNEWGRCGGRWRIEHVKTEPRMGKRAEPTLLHLMALCQQHTEDGMRAGAVWATAHRAEQREYLLRVNGVTAS